MPSSTWQALGNRYVVSEPSARRLRPSDARELARGTDGVLEILAWEGSRLEIEIWNPDGSRAELSGNGTRIAAAWFEERTGATEIDVVVGGRVVSTRIREGGEIEQHLGSVTVGQPDEVDGIAFIPVSVGNPHAVVLGDPDDLPTIGPFLETHSRFPSRTNVQVARVDAPGEVTARVWERGVGETRSSGTSAVAVAAATHDGGEVRVHFPGGALCVRLVDGDAILVGTAERLT